MDLCAFLLLNIYLIKLKKEKKKKEKRKKILFYYSYEHSQTHQRKYNRIHKNR